MTHYKKSVELTEVEIFLKKFNDKSIKVESINGKIISVDTDDKEVITFLKKSGMKQT